MTPAQRHQGTDIAILEARKAFYEEAKASQPECWRGSTRHWERPATVWLNPVRQENKQPPAKAGGFELRTESPDTRRLNDAS